MRNKKKFDGLNSFEQLLIFVSAITGYVSFSDFALSVGIPISIASSVVG